MSGRTGYLIEAVTQYASGNTSGEEYILREFLETTIDLAELVVYISMFNYVVGKISGGATGGNGGSGIGGTGEAESGAGEMAMLMREGEEILQQRMAYRYQGGLSEGVSY